MLRLLAGICYTDYRISTLPTKSEKSSLKGGSGMRKNLFVAILAPCVLTVVLIIIIIIDSRSSKKPDPPAVDTVVTITPTEEPEPTSSADPTPEPQATPTKAPTEAPTKAPTKAPTLTPTPTPTPSPTPTPVQEASGDITGTPENPDQSGGTEGTDPSGSSGTEEPDPNGSSGTEESDPNGSSETVSPNTYDALYTLQGDAYTLIADSVTGSFLFIDNSNQSIRQTEFMFAPEYREVDRWVYGPILAYKNNKFFFMAGNQLVASDGQTETVLYTFGESSYSSIAVLNIFAESQNRFMAGREETLVVVDSRILAVETYHHDYSPEFAVLSDEGLCFRIWHRIPAGPYFNILYSAKGGNIKQLGMIGEIDEYVLDGNNAIIKSNDELFTVNLSTGALTGPRELEREYTLHLPVYSSGYVGGLSEIRYINYNSDAKPVQSIEMPDSWEVQCYYANYYAVPYFYIIRNKEKSSLLPSEFGSFMVVDTTTFPLVESKYLAQSSVKEKLFEGETSLGAGEIFLLERYDSYYNQSTQQTEQVPYEIIYAWIPIQGKTQAYQFYFYVPHGEAYQDYLTLMKHFIQAQ